MAAATGGTQVSFIAPAAFGLLLLLPIIVAMYLLKLRRETQVVPSVYLWQRMVREMEANAPWQYSGIYCHSLKKN